MKRIFMVGYSTDKGGVESYIVNLCSMLPKSEYEIIYAWPEMKIAGKTWICPKNRHNYFKYWLFWKHFFKENPFDILYYNACDIVSIDMLKFAKKAGVPVRIIHSHSAGNQMSIGRELSFFHKITEKANRKKIDQYATHLFACSKAAGKWMFAGHPFTIIKNGIHLSAFQYSATNRKQRRAELNIDKEIVVGCIGRLEQQKNLAFAIDVFEKVCKITSNAVLVFIGDGSMLDSLRQAAKEKRLENKAFFIGNKDNVNEWMSAIDCLLMPSLFEGLPFVLVEAQAAGLPCIVSSAVSEEANITGLVEYVSLEEQKEVWAQKILTACKGRRPDTARQLIDAGYSIEDTAKEVSAIIEKALRS